MNFLAPLFFAGIAAVTLPFIFHLIRRSSREKLNFSSLMFLEPSPPRITKRSRLEHIFLLLLRCAVICLLALAFARPFLPKAMPPAAAEAGKTRVILLIDASASMRRDDLWSQARTRAAGIARSLKPEDSLAVYTFDQQVRSVLSFSEHQQTPPGDRIAALEARLNNTSPNWASTHLGNAIITAVEHLLDNLNADAGDQGNRHSRLIVISDFQSGAKLEGLQGFEWPKKLEVQLEALPAKEQFNAHLQILEDPQRTFLVATNSTLRVRVHNSPQARGEQFQVFWQGGAGLLGDKVSAYVPPGQSRIVTLSAKPEGATSLMLTGDAVSLDNTVYSAQSASRTLTIAYWGSGESENDPNAMRYYIHRAFEQTNLATRVLALSNSVSAEASEAAFLVLADPSSSPGLEFARKILEQGRTVLFPLRSGADANSLSELVGGVLVSATEAPVRNYALFGRLDFQNPLLAPFSDARFSDFTKIHFWKHRALTLANVTNATVIAEFDSGTPALVSIPVAQGRLLVLATTWRPGDSQLALSSKFVPLLFGLLEQSASISSARHHFIVGDVVPLPHARTNDLVLPDGKTVTVAGRAFPETTTPGLYRAGSYEFAVNLDPAESRFAPLVPEDLASLGVPIGKSSESADLAAAQERKRHLLATEAESRQKLWRYFLLVALAILVIETWLSGRLSRNVAQA